MVRPTNLNKQVHFRADGALSEWLQQQARPDEDGVSGVVRRIIDARRRTERALSQHFVGAAQDGTAFLYCPGTNDEGPIISWHPDDARNKYCPNHKKFFNELEP